MALLLRRTPGLPNSGEFREFPSAQQAPEPITEAPPEPVKDSQAMLAGLMAARRQARNTGSIRGFNDNYRQEARKFQPEAPNPGVPAAVGRAAITAIRNSVDVFFYGPNAQSLKQSLN